MVQSFYYSFSTTKVFAFAPTHPAIRSHTYGSLKPPGLLLVRLQHKWRILNRFYSPRTPWPCFGVKTGNLALEPIQITKGRKKRIEDSWRGGTEDDWLKTPKKQEYSGKTSFLSGFVLDKGQFSLVKYHHIVISHGGAVERFSPHKKPIC